MFRILSLAGGGLRGAFAIGLLSALEEQLEHPIGHHFDLIAGTSTGSITACALCKGMTASELQAFYLEHSERIFKPREPYEPKSIYRPLYAAAKKFLTRRSMPDLDHFFQSRYCPFSLHDALEIGFGDTRLRDLAECRLLVPSVNVSDGKTRVFRTPHLPRESKTSDWTIVDIITASAAAPTYFPHKTLPDGKAYVDGGLWANDPGFAALSEAVRITDQCRRKNDIPFKIEDVWMLSLGTGQANYSLSPPAADAGMLFWAKHIAEVMSVSQVQGTQLPLRFVLEDRYRQIDFQITDPSWTLDNLNVVPELFELGQQRGRKALDELMEPFFSTTTKRYSPYEQDC